MLRKLLLLWRDIKMGWRYVSANEPVNEVVLDYWLENYATTHCTICCNHGYIDSRGITTNAGVLFGKLNYCICPTGQSLRQQNAPLPWPPQPND